MTGVSSPKRAANGLFSAADLARMLHTLRAAIEQGGPLSCDAVTLAAEPFLTAVIGHFFPARPILVVTDGPKRQETFHHDLETWLAVLGAPLENATAGRPLLFFPGWEVLPSEGRLPHADIISERLETLVALGRFRDGSSGGPAPIVVTTAAALRQATFPPAVLKERTRQISRADTINPLDLVEWLEEQSYEPESQVNHKGELALRGGILDIYPLNSPWPVRLEFFGDDLESIRYFDPHTQISREETDRITLAPAGELGILRKESAGPRAAKPTSLVDYFTEGSIFLIGGQGDGRSRGSDSHSSADDPFFIPPETIQEKMALPGLSTIYLSETPGSFEIDADSASGVDLDPAAANRGGASRETVMEPQGPDPAPLPNCPVFESLDPFRAVVDRLRDPQVADTARREFFGQIHRWLRQGTAVYVFCNNEGERERFQEIWREYSQATGPNSTRSGPLLEPELQLGSLSRGFLWPGARLAIVTDSEIFGRYKVQRARRLKSPHAVAARSALEIDFTHLEPGDYVVHIQHGIGRFLGLNVMPGAGSEPGGSQKGPALGRECLVIEYAQQEPEQPAPKLYVPVSEAHLVSKYVGTGRGRPALNVLGGTRWAKTKAVAEVAIRDLAGELLAIQAARASQAGFSFPADTGWQREFESAFLFEETPDQLRAIEETKGDLEAARPMDRLICGDVGFGKTEVAIRAAFKAVMGGKQAAVLVPTTVLAQQHYNTFRERMADYPVRIELLSRYRTPREQKNVLRGLAEGAVDIVIGTHRLVQSDVAFKDLGLVIIDEEQRFGVLQKEKFKELRRLVDVLTLSATPIPRTLYLALTGARDMSTIETPPHDRLPVETIITPYDERVIRDAIVREINRQGQVFFLHNRVTDIADVGRRLATLVPNARMVIGHGQMPADELEEVMTRFVNGEADVLLSTTIIESGLDIPNANTIIIDRADRFGLSDLYQLRGRVGRYKHQAYAYLLLPRHAGLIADARKRISAIKQYSSLGSGFKIAMRDLEIRGAGNLLGAEQSGHIAAVGFDLYCQLLKQSVSSLKGEKVKPRIEVALRLDFLAFSLDEQAEAAGRPSRDGGPAQRTGGPRNALEEKRPEPALAYLPFKYIEDPQARIEIYRKIAQITDRASSEALRRELRDRFGPLPPAVDLLLQATELKLLAALKRVTVLETQGEKLMLTRNGDFVMIGGKFPRLSKREPKARLNEIKKILLAMTE